MHRLTPWIVTALLLAPSAANAGPVAWNYEAEVSAFNGSFAYFGTESQTTYDPGTKTETQTPYLMIADISRYLAGPTSGSQTLRVGSFGAADLTPTATNDPWAIERPAGFDLKFTLTDLLSSQATILTFAMSGQSNGYFQSGTGVVSIGIEDRTDTVLLGSRRYTVHPSIVRLESGDALDLQVTAASATPEPGTAVLAFLGLVGCGAARLRRK